MRKLSLLALVLGFAAACRDTSSGDDTANPDSGGGSGDVKIQDIQNPAMTSGTPVTLNGVVVTAIDNYGAKTGDFWVQEPDGGEFSGIHVYGAPLDAVGGLTVGAVINISGAEKDEFEYSDFEPGFGITELKPVAGGVMTIQNTGMTMVLQPQPINALMIGALPDYMARADEWEKWEGVLISVENVRASTDQDCVGSACNDPKLQKLEVTGDLVVESAISAFPYDYKNAMAFNKGDCLNKVTGVLDYFFDYLLLPRTSDEYGANTGTCPTEDNATACADGMDNDGNGFMDCNDNACIGAVSSCRTVTTISAIQTASTPPAGGIELQGVYVTALQRVNTGQKPRSMYVQTNAAASANNGILVFGNTTTDLSAFAVGQKVNVIGKVTEFNDMMGTGTLSEISLISVTAATGTGTITAVTGQMAVTLSMDVTGEPYEGVLVTLDNVKLTMLAEAMYHVGQMTQGATTFKFDDDLYRIAEGAGGVALNTCYDTITGIWSYQVYDNAWYFLPTGAGDTVGGTCP